MKCNRRIAFAFRIYDFAGLDKFKITKKLNNPIYWIAIILSTLLFAVGHFSVAFVSIPKPSSLLLIYILIGNSIGGLVFGWLYWKKGLEAAIIAHAFAHVAKIIKT